MRTPRAFIRLTALAMAVFLAVSVTAAVRLYQSGPYGRRLADPSTADRTELLYWVVTRDLNEETPETRRVLAHRLDEEFRAGIDWGTVGEQLDAERRARLWRNVPLLLEPWFMEKVDGYFNESDERRVAYLDGVIDSVAVWAGMDAILPGVAEEDGATQRPAGLTEMLLDEVGRWQQRSAPPERRRIAEFLAAMQARWLARELIGAGKE
ncbi:MAG: hypothetical protein NTW96_02830 [Planctomycetia bacterium]|nr:hypothetical protein [Planctomycetia bacterium]